MPHDTSTLQISKCYIVLSLKYMKNKQTVANIFMSTVKGLNPGVTVDRPVVLKRTVVGDSD